MAIRKFQSNANLQKPDSGEAWAEESEGPLPCIEKNRNG